MLRSPNRRNDSLCQLGNASRCGITAMLRNPFECLLMCIPHVRVTQSLCFDPQSIADILSPFRSHLQPHVSESVIGSDTNSISEHITEIYSGFRVSILRSEQVQA